MRIKNICLEWFRGAASEICLEIAGKSLVVYGPNGAGKSCFVDSAEYITHDGKIGHLSHEYSGRKQEKGLSNTSIPADRKAKIKLRLVDDSELNVELDEKGNCTFLGNPTDDPRQWNYRRTVLRQDEVSDFIKDTKTNKYSALLPLLGLEGMEIAAENLRVITKKVEGESNLNANKIKITSVLDRKARVENAQSIEDQLDHLYVNYCRNLESGDFTSKTTELTKAIADRIKGSSAEQRQHVLLQQLAGIDLTTAVEAVRSLNEKLVASVEPHIEARIGILENVSSFLGNIDTDSISCPACGQVIPTDDFRGHIDREETRLRELSRLLVERRTAIGQFCDLLKSLQSTLRNPDLANWIETLSTDKAVGIQNYDIDSLRQNWGEELLVYVLVDSTEILGSARDAEKNAPVDAQQLAADQQLVGVCAEIIETQPLQQEVDDVGKLIAFLKATEQSIRGQIREQAKAVVGAISADIQKYWSILHPDIPIESVELFIPDADKAIDIHLKFYGKEQDSPRLTLSEGYRNSLGLCIFLAMAKFEGDTDRPIILDDVVVSLDRTHRGMIAELLETEFANYQVLVFTHDRDWYAELGHLLPQAPWIFKVLLPYDTPAIGIRFSDKNSTFEEARALLDTRSDAAGNDARKIMDTELAMIADKLQLRMPFKRGEKNDKRMAHEFAQELGIASSSCYQIKIDGKWVKNEAAIAALDDADRKLLAWANRASHTHDVNKPEATKLLASCEVSLAQFKCANCKKFVWYANAGGPEIVQCECGTIRWRYGKDE